MPGLWLTCTLQAHPSINPSPPLHPHCRPDRFSSSESKDQLVWGYHSLTGPAVSMTSWLLPDWLGCEQPEGEGSKQGTGLSGRRPSSACSLQLTHQPRECKGLGAAETFLTLTKPTRPKSIQENQVSSGRASTCLSAWSASQRGALWQAIANLPLRTCDCTSLLLPIYLLPAPLLFFLFPK